MFYHPKDDIYHCIFRFITIAHLQTLDKFEFDRLRIYDFYFVFPHFIKEIGFPRKKGMTQIKSAAIKINEPYENLPNKKRLFSEMGDYQIQALQVLVAKDIFCENRGKISISSAYHSKAISELVLDCNSQKSQFLHEFFAVLDQVDMVGNNGLKKRTDLMEYRYDAV